MSKILENNIRSNYHLDNITHTTAIQPSSTQIYLFAHSLQTAVITSLMALFEKKKYNYHGEQIGKYSQIQLKPSKKAVCLIQVNQQNKDQNVVIPKIISNQNLKTVTFGKKNINSGYTHYTTENELSQFLQKYLQKQSNNRIKLASVHSIKSLDKNKEITKSTINNVFTDNKYNKVLYYKNVYDENEKLSPLYQLLIQSLQNQKNFESFSSSKELEKKQQMQDKKKYLVLLSTNDKSISLMKEINKINKSLFDFMLLGDLNPNKQLLDKRVILASNAPDKHISFFISHGFSSYSLHQLMQKYQKQTKYSKDYYQKKNLNQQYKNGHIYNQTNSDYKSPTSTIMAKNVDEQHIEKKKIIKKIKSPTKQRKSNDQQIKISQPHETSSLNINTYELNNNMLKNSNANIKSSKVTQSRKQIININVNHQNTNQYSIDPKYTIIPSAIIHQNSQEYKGSNKESIVNLQPELSYKSMKQVNGNGNISHIKYSSHVNPQEEIYDKKIVTKSFVGNHPQRQYIHISQNTIEQPISSTHINNVYNKSIYQSRMQAQLSPHIQASKNTSNRIIEQSRSNRNVPTPTRQSINIEENYYNNQYVSDSPKIVPSYSPKRIAAPPINVYSPSNINNNHNNAYGGNNSNNTSNYPSSSGGIYQLGSLGAHTTRTYGKSPQNISSQQYNSPSKTTIKKTNIISPQVVNINEQSKKSINEQARITFANFNRNQSPSFNNNQVQTYNSSKNITNSPSSYYNVQTLNYNDINRSSNHKIQIPSRKPDIISSSHYQTDYNTFSNKYQPKIYGVSNGTINNNNIITKNQEQIKKYQNNQEVKTVISSNNANFNNNGINWNDYEEIQRDGVKVFKKKGAINSPTSRTSSYYESSNNVRQFNRQSQSPKVQRYEVSPLRDRPYTNAVNNVTSSFQVRTYNKDNHHQTRYQSPSKKYQNYSSTYNYVVNKPSQYENMIQSSIKKGKQDNKYETTTYKTVQMRQTYGNNNGINGAKVYGINYQPVRVSRNQIYSPKVQAINELYQQMKYNQGQIFLKPSQELISDNSILTRNNIKFGVKPKKAAKRQSSSVINSKIMSGMFGMNDLNKKMALNRAIRGKQYIREQLNRYRHIDTTFNNFHFIVQEDMFYITDILKEYIMTNRDNLQTFNGIDELFNCLKQDDISQIDGGCIFIKKQYLNRINIDLIPQDYYFVFVEPLSQIQSHQTLSQKAEEILEISQMNKQIKINDLKYLQLSLKIILDNKLYQYIVYNIKDKDISLLAKKFINTQFIIEQLQTEFSVDILDCYFNQQTRLTRAYVLCHAKDLSKIMSVKQQYVKINHAFENQTCKIICVLDKSEKKSQMVGFYGTKDVIFIQNSRLIKDCKQLLVSQTEYLANQLTVLPHDIIFIHDFHKNLEKQLQNHFPGRFQYQFFDKITQLNLKLLKFNKKDIKTQNYYLILSESCKNQKINVADFKKVYMLGKVKVIQNKVIRVMNSKQLFQLLKK